MDRELEAHIALRSRLAAAIAAEAPTPLAELIINDLGVPAAELLIERLR